MSIDLLLKLDRRNPIRSCGAFLTHHAFLPVIFGVLVSLFMAAPARAVVTTDGSLICDGAAQQGAAAHGVPVDILRALTRTETGRPEGGTLTPWPWTVNMEGAGFWFDSRAEALAFVKKRHAAGARSFDIGCFQINFRWHGDAFASLDAMFDPAENGRYAARFIAELAAEGRGWTDAAGAFHSRTPSFADKYKDRFARILANLGPAEIDRGAPPVISVRSDPAPTTGAGQGVRMPGGVFASGPAHGNPDRARIAAFGGVALTAFARPGRGILTAASPLIVGR